MENLPNLLEKSQYSENKDELSQILGNNKKEIMEPVDDYYYYRDLTYCDEKRSVYFMGVSEKDKDGENNFFSLTAVEGNGHLRGNGHACVPFTFRDGTKGEWGYRIVFSMLVIRMSLKVPEGLKIAVEDDRCYIYLDEDNTIGLYPDYDGEILERSGDYHYYLNTEDFFNMGGYCFYTTDLSDGVFWCKRQGNKDGNWKPSSWRQRS